MADVIAHLDGHRELPARAALITFDDGWIDTLTIAGAELKRRGLPAVVFIPPAIFDSEGPFWQGRLAYSVRSGFLQRADMLDILRAVGVDLEGAPSDASDLIDWAVARLFEIPAARRDAALAATGRVRGDGSQHFLRADQLPALNDCGIAVGAHGYSHEPLPRVDAPAELARSRFRLSELTGRDVAAMSLPHGRFTEATMRQAFDAGFKAVFTSERRLHDPRESLGAGRARFGRTEFFRLSARPGVMGYELNRQLAEHHPFAV